MEKDEFIRLEKSVNARLKEWSNIEGRLAYKKQRIDNLQQENRETLQKLQDGMETLSVLEEDYRKLVSLSSKKEHILQKQKHDLKIAKEHYPHLMEEKSNG